MKHLFFSLALLNTAIIFSAADSSTSQLALPEVIIGTATAIGSREFPYSVPFNQELKVFGDQPSRLVGSFYSNSKLAAMFLQKNFLPIFQSFKQEADITGFSKILETAFNKKLSTKCISDHEHADAINSTHVTFSFLHLLAGGYCAISGLASNPDAVFATNWFNGTSGSGPLSPYYSYKNMLSKLFIMHLNATLREDCAIAGALQAGTTPDDAARLALITISYKTEQSDEVDSRDVLSFVQFTS